MLSSKSTESKWCELIDAFEGEVEELKKLEPREGEVIDGFRTWRKLGRRYPLTCSFQEFAEQINRKGTYLENAGADIAARWAAKAAILWLSQKNGHAVGRVEPAQSSVATQPGKVTPGIVSSAEGLSQQIAQEAEKALDTCFSALKQLREQAWHPEAVLDVCALLEPCLGDLQPRQRARLLENQGLSLQALNRHAEAHSAYASAREAWQQAQAPGHAAWNLTLMSHCLGGQGQLAEAIAGHQQAYEGLLALQWLLPAAWNLGQIARHTIRLVSPDAAWDLLDSSEFAEEEHRMRALKKLGDAVCDAARLDGEAQAFALGRQLLAGLAARPRYPAQAALRAWWIDMIGMGVPHAVLRDLLGEIPALFGENAELAMLCSILAAWLDDLDCPPEERAARRQTLDPDLAATLESLALHLSPEARARLQLST